MSRIIIDNKSNRTDVDALRIIKRIILDGFQSTETIQGEKNVPKYCHVTAVRRSELDVNRTIVWARPRKTKQSAYSFLLYDEEEMNEHE